MPAANRNKIVLMHWNGRFGNRMFTYAFLRHYAETFGLEVWLPSHWEGDVLFENRVHRIIDDDELRLYLNQSIPPFDHIDARMAAVHRFNQRTGDQIEYMNPDNPDEYGRVNVCIDSLCCFHPHIFGKYSAERMRETYFRFSEQVRQSDLYRRLEDRQGTYTVAHLRRDDIADAKNHTNQGYSVLSRASYEKAFRKYGYDPKTIEWVTDDKTGSLGIPSRRYPDHWSYPVGATPVPEVFFSWFPDFLKLMFAKAVFRANSSFSWWACFLGNARVYSPRLHTRVLFHETGRELDVEFEEGNHPHWLCVQGQDQCDDILIR